MAVCIAIKTKLEVHVHDVSKETSTPSSSSLYKPTTLTEIRYSCLHVYACLDYYEFDSLAGCCRLHSFYGMHDIEASYQCSYIHWIEPRDRPWHDHILVSLWIFNDTWLRWYARHTVQYRSPTPRSYYRSVMILQAAISQLTKWACDSVVTVPGMVTLIVWRMSEFSRHAAPEHGRHHKSNKSSISKKHEKFRNSIALMVDTCRPLPSNFWETE